MSARLTDFAEAENFFKKGIDNTRNPCYLITTGITRNPCYSLTTEKPPPVTAGDGHREGGAEMYNHGEYVWNDQAYATVDEADEARLEGAYSEEDT
jgi:hypothetical protein